MLLSHSAVAQSGLEHLLWEQGVVGSNPTSATSITDYPINSPVAQSGWSNALIRHRSEVQILSGLPALVR